MKTIIPILTLALSMLSARADYDFSKMIQPVPLSAKFEDPGFIVWCGSMLRDEQGKHHLFYSRWPRALGHYAWVTHSEVAHAVADHPLGPYKFVDVALPERGADKWDGLCTHNPTVMKFGTKYYLYYMGNTGDRKKAKDLNWTHRNNQRIGVAVADSPNGPWTRTDQPLIATTPGFHDGLCNANPSVTRRPDGGYLMVYKAVGDKGKPPFGGPVVHVVATSESPTGPFKKHPNPVFTKTGDDFAAEDPYIWRGKDRYWAIVKDFKGGFTGKGTSLALFESGDGIDWKASSNPLVSTLNLEWADGQTTKLLKLERPQVYFENGEPAVLFCAAALPDKLDDSFNVQIPLKPLVPRGAAALPQGSLLPGGTSKWKLAWSEEFDGPDAKLDERWISQNGPSGHILCSRWRENATVENGMLRLTNKKEKRGGQDWTSGSILTKEKFQYGYFECRYRYAAAEGTNNSFWLMTQNKNQPKRGKSFEIDINEGHFPNEINTNIHNWTDVKVVNGKKTHPSSSKSFSFGLRPDVTIQLEIPVKTKRIRLVSNHASHFHVGEFRIYGVSPSGYPDPFSSKSSKEQPSFVNFAGTAAITTSGFHQNGPDTSARMVDGNINTSWISQSEGTKSVEFALPETQTIGCVQFLNGWKDGHKWRGLMEDYRIEYHDGKKWVAMAKFDLHEGQFNFARDFQTYGLEWSEEELVFYFNGKPIRREKNSFCHSESPIWLSLAIIGWAGKISDAIDGTFMEVDYVRVYQPK